MSSVYHVVNPMINRPFGDGLYMFIPPISGDDAVVYWLCQLDPLRSPHAAGARKDPGASASRVSRQATLGQSGLESTDQHHDGSCHSSNQELVRQQTWPLGTCFGLATARKNHLQLGFLMVPEFTSPTYTLYPGILGNKMTVWRLSPLTKLVLNVHPNIQERK